MIRQPQEGYCLLASVDGPAPDSWLLEEEGLWMTGFTFRAAVSLEEGGWAKLWENWANANQFLIPKPELNEDFKERALTEASGGNHSGIPVFRCISHRFPQLMFVTLCVHY